MKISAPHFTPHLPSALRPQIKNADLLAAPLRPEYPVLTCIVPAYNEAENLRRLVPMLDDALHSLSLRYSILIVDDGSTDGTSATAIALAAHYPVKLVQLSRNFGKENAITAGLDHIDADADAVILMDADCQHPVELLPVFLRYWQDGFDMVYGVISVRSAESAFKRQATKWFYSMLNRASSISIVPNAGDFRLFDKLVVTALRALPERTRFMKGLYCWVGFRSMGVPYQPEVRHSGCSQFNLRRLTHLALTGFTSFSVVPLQMWTAIGALVSLSSIFYGIYIALRTLIHGVDVPGWATLTVSMTLLGGIQLLSIGILGEYIGRIFTEVKGRPSYLVRFQHGFEEPNRKS